MYKIRYTDFWPNFIPENFVLTQMARKICGSEIEISKNPNEKVNLEIYSVFSYSSLSNKVAGRLKSTLKNSWREDFNSRSLRGYRTILNGETDAKFWYTGENLRPPNDQFDATISFDLDDLKLKNLFLPYWITRLDLGMNSKQSEIYPKLEDLLGKRKYQFRPRSVCTFSSVSEPTRMRYLRALSNSGTFDSIGRYGSLYGKRVDSKLRTAEQYLFQLCNENDLYPNYVTEKLQEAYVAGNIPVWAGLDSANFFNKNAFIDLTGLNSSEIEDKFKKLTEDEIVHIYEQPLLNRIPSIDHILESFSKFFPRI